MTERTEMIDSLDSLENMSNSNSKFYNFIEKYFIKTKERAKVHKFEKEWAVYQTKSDPIDPNQEGTPVQLENGGLVYCIDGLSDDESDTELSSSEKLD